MSLFHHFTLMQLLGEISSISVGEAKKINGFQPRVGNKRLQLKNKWI